MRLFGVIASSLLKKITDTFTRTNTTTGLGTTSSGSLWSAIRGNWFVDTNAAKSTDTATTYPIATVDAGSANPTVLLDTAGNGVGISFWVSDSTNWWGVYPYQSTSYSSSCNGYGTTCVTVGYGSYSYCSATGPYCSSRTYGCAHYTAVAAKYTAPASFTAAYTYCDTYGSYCTTYAVTCTTTSYGTYSYCSATGTACNSYTQTSSAGTTYLRMVKSVANTVTTVVDQAVTTAIASIKLMISGGTITAQGYTSAGQVSQTGTDLVETPVSPTTSTKHGLILGPGGYTQETTADNLTITM